MGVGEASRESEEGRREPAWGRQEGRENYAGRSGQTGPSSQGAGCTFELCPLLARQAWDSILSGGSVGKGRGLGTVINKEPKKGVPALLASLSGALEGA